MDAINRHCFHLTLLFVTCCVTASAVHAREDEMGNSDVTPYLEAVQIFADNVLKYGMDTYGPKQTPLFVDGLNLDTHEPVRWKSTDEERVALREPLRAKRAVEVGGAGEFISRLDIEHHDHFLVCDRDKRPIGGPRRERTAIGAAWRIESTT